MNDLRTPQDGTRLVAMTQPRRRIGFLYMFNRLLLVSLAVFAVSASPSVAGAYPVPPNNIVVDDATVVAGQSITLTAKTFMTATSVTFTMFSSPIVLGSASANTAGVAVLVTAVPGVTAGLHTVEASGTGVDGLPLTVSTNVDVSVSGATTTTVAGTGTLPRTGSNSTLPMARIAVSLLAVGALMVFAARWRQQHTTIPT